MFHKDHSGNSEATSGWREEIVEGFLPFTHFAIMLKIKYNLIFYI